MAAVFDISTVSNTITLDAKRKTQISFTVSNRLKMKTPYRPPLRGRAKVVPLENAKPEWFTITDRPDRDFITDDTPQDPQKPQPPQTFNFNVQVLVPAEVPPGKFSFCLFYLDYARFPQGYFNSGLLDAVGIYVYDAYAENCGEKPIVRKLTPHIESVAWNSPSSISQTMTATAGGSLQVDPSVISPTWQLSLKASVLRETKLDLQDGKKYELKDPASTMTKVVNDPQYKGEFSGYRNASRYTVLIVDSFVDGKITVSAGIGPKSNQIAVTVRGKQPIAVDISNVHSAMSNGAKILVGFKTYTLKRDTDGRLDVVEDRRDRAWSDLLTKSSPF